MTVLDELERRPRPTSVNTHATHATHATPGDTYMQAVQECKVANPPEAFEGMEAPEQNGGPEMEEMSTEKESGSTARRQKAPLKTDRSPVRGRRKSRWKLKFHHQALPPEYLKHYKQQEKKRRQSEGKKSGVNVGKTKKTKKSECETERAESERGEESERERLKDEESKEWGLRCKASEELLNPNLKSISQLNIDISQNKAFLENLLTNQIEINRVEKDKKVRSVRRERQSIPSSGRIMNYSDLPYMGEITLDGIKPRRGRKPKKADICHLIYKNYGQVFPGAPSSEVEEKKQRKWKPQVNSSLIAKEHRVESPLPSVSGLINHTEVQNRIINSLLEKRLTQEMRVKSEEPLNLCVRDLQSLKIKLSRKHGNIYEAKHEEVKAEVEDVIKKEARSESEFETSEDEDLAPFNLVTTELRESSDDDSFLNFNEQVTLTKINSPEERLLVPKEEKPDELPSPVMYWPGNNLFLPSPLLYCERLGAADMGPSPSFTEPKPSVERRPKPPKSRTDGMKPPVKRTVPKVKNNSTQVIAKRKRSAIFIPPVPAENTANPATEVSICKFKFTGGAKPSLQEKKMLSVDSGGNFRYYSGTGDKSMRGYEYFPRESLQQCQENTGCSPSGVFLTASALGSGEKIPEDIGHSGFFDSNFPIQVTKPEPAVTKVKSPRRPLDRYQTLRERLTESPSLVSLPEDERISSDNSEGYDLQNVIRNKYLEQLRSQEEGREEGPSRKRCRRTRKSLAREKLEQTFKEKGFLIQTQQLESAEGATYCKFRQLRKFTRYLFRSWKDYLPGNVRDLSVDAGVEGLEAQGLPLDLEAVTPLEEADLEKPFC